MCKKPGSNAAFGVIKSGILSAFNSTVSEINSSVKRVINFLDNIYQHSDEKDKRHIMEMRNKILNKYHDTYTKMGSELDKFGIK